MADYGYDVWLINLRCTEFAQHQHISQSSDQYWQFSFHEMAKYDLPAVIDYVLMQTNHHFLHYVGHSQGTTVVLAMLSLYPRYNKKLKTVHLMSPAVYFSNAAIPLRTIVMFSETVEVFIHKFDSLLKSDIWNEFKNYKIELASPHCCWYRENTVSTGTDCNSWWIFVQ